MLTIILWALLKILIIVGFTMAMAALLTITDRRESSMIQDRLGPNRAPLFSSEVWNVTGKIRLIGIVHVIADALKMVFKEDFSVKKGNKFIHTISPILAFSPGLVILSVIPFGGTTAGGLSFQITNFGPGVLFAFAFASLGVYGIALAGWSSNSKFSLLGGIRATAQMISYEVALGLSLMGIFLIFGTLNLGEIVQGQQALTANGTPDLLFGFLPKWGLFLQPFALFLYFAAATAETKRAPFDVPEAESELVAGFFTEYGSMKMGAFLFGEYIEVIIFSMMFTTMFLGGYHLPYLYSNGFHFFGHNLAMNATLVAIIQLFTFFGKVIFVAWFHLVIRWTLPRFRYDQVINLGWKMLFPAALLNMAITAIVLTFIK